MQSLIMTILSRAVQHERTSYRQQMHLADEVVIHVGLTHDAISKIENVHCIGWRLTIINANSMTDTIQWTFHHIVAL